MSAYDRWLEESYDSSWRDDRDERDRFCSEDYMTNEEIKESLREAYLEDQYELYCATINPD
jgi:hypothetical protein